MKVKAKSKVVDDRSQVEIVIAHIRKSIADGTLRQGTRVGERQIARNLGLGRGPVREAIQILIGRRVLERLPRHAARVRQLTLKEVLEVAELWCALGPLASRLAAQRIYLHDNRDRVTAAAAHVWSEVRKADTQRIAQAVAALTALIGELSENTYLPAVRDTLMLEHYVQSIAEITLARKVQDEYVRRLRALVEAILAGNPARAEAEHTSLLAWVGSLLAAEYGAQRSAS